MENKGEIVIFESEDGLAKLNVNLKDENVWLTMDQMATLYDKAKSTISEHIQDIFNDGELIEAIVMKKFGNSEFSKKPTNYYNLDMILAVGYRVRSKRGLQFRIWATNVLKEYKKYQVENLSDIEKEYLKSIQLLEKKAKKKKE